jgi:hypothetical protein
VTSDQGQLKRTREFNADDTPNTVVAAVVCGSVVVPFLIVLGVLFITHGLFVNVDQPDVTDSRVGEAIVGGVMIAVLLLVVLGLSRLLSGRDRWIFVVGQLISLAASIDFVVDKTRGDAAVPAVVLVASLAALVLAFVPDSWGWVKSHGGRVDLSASRDA